MEADGRLTQNKPKRYKPTTYARIATEDEISKTLLEKLNQEDYAWISRVFEKTDKNIDRFLALFIKAGLIEEILT